MALAWESRHSATSTGLVLLHHELAAAGGRRIVGATNSRVLQGNMRDGCNGVSSPSQWRGRAAEAWWLPSSTSLIPGRWLAGLGRFKRPRYARPIPRLPSLISTPFDTWAKKVPISRFWQRLSRWHTDSFPLISTNAYGERHAVHCGGVPSTIVARHRDTCMDSYCGVKAPGTYSPSFPGVLGLHSAVRVLRTRDYSRC